MIAETEYHPLRKRWLNHSGIPRKYRRVLLDDLDPYAPEVDKVFRGWLNAVIEGRIIVQESAALGTGLALIGQPGHGKTTLACALLNEIIVNAPLDAFVRPNVGIRPQGPVYFAYYPNLLDLAKKSYNDPDGTVQLRLDEIFGRGYDPVQVLVIDDLGKEHRTASGWAENYFDHLVRSRFLMGLPTIVTTNVPLTNWGQVYGEAMASFAHEALTPLAILSAKGDRRL